MKANEAAKNHAFWFVQCTDYMQWKLLQDIFAMKQLSNGWYIYVKEQNVFTSFWTTLYLGGTDKAGDGSNEGCPHWMH